MEQDVFYIWYQKLITYLKRDWIITNRFDCLDENVDKCDNELSLTHQFLIENHLPIIEWLEINAGYCDYEVLANVESLFEEMKVIEIIKFGCYY